MGSTPLWPKKNIRNSIPTHESETWGLNSSFDLLPSSLVFMSLPSQSLSLSLTHPSLSRYPIIKICLSVCLAGGRQPHIMYIYEPHITQREAKSHVRHTHTVCSATSQPAIKTHNPLNVSPAGPQSFFNQPSSYSKDTESHTDIVCI